MKKSLIFLFIIVAFSFFGCETLVNTLVQLAPLAQPREVQVAEKIDSSEEIVQETPTRAEPVIETPKEVEPVVETPAVTEKMDFSVFGFNKTSVFLRWDTERTNVRFNIYVKDKNNRISCVERNYGKTDFFVASDNKSSYAVGLLVNDKEIYRTDFTYPDLKTGFPVHAEISDDSFMGVECFYVSNIDSFSLRGEKENGKTFFTKKYPKEEMNSFLLPIRYDEGSHNNWFTLVFLVDDMEYVSAKYYFDYDDHLKAKKEGSVTFYPSL